MERTKIVMVERETDRKSRLVECGDIVLDLEHVSALLVGTWRQGWSI